MIGIAVETGAGMQRQRLKKLQVWIDDEVHSVMACINQANSFILGIDILKYYTLTIDGDRAGILVNNSRVPTVEEEFRFL
jgi:hypothetical protein